MTKIQAFCGLDCEECEAYIATQKNDRAGLEATAKKWTEQFGAMNITADMCICDGCDTLKRFFTFAPVLKDRLEAIRKEIEK